MRSCSPKSLWKHIVAELYETVCKIAVVYIRISLIAYNKVMEETFLCTEKNYMDRHRNWSRGHSWSTEVLITVKPTLNRSGQCEKDLTELRMLKYNIPKSESR